MSDLMERVRDAIGEEKSARMIESFGEEEFMALTMAGSIGSLKEVKEVLDKNIEASEEEVERLIEEIEAKDDEG